MQKLFAKGVGYRPYPLKNRSQKNDLKIASRKVKLVKKLSSQFVETDFDDIIPISILTFLEKFCNNIDSIGIHDGATIWLVS